MAGLCDDGVPLLELVGPQLHERPEEQPRVKLQAELPVPPPVAPAKVPTTDAPSQLGEHKRAVKHATFLQCLDLQPARGESASYRQIQFCLQAYPGLQTAQDQEA
eukprot:1560643-Amphidinium_carterae.2